MTKLFTNDIEQFYVSKMIKKPSFDLRFLVTKSPSSFSKSSVHKTNSKIQDFTKNLALISMHILQSRFYRQILQEKSVNCPKLAFCIQDCRLMKTSQHKNNVSIQGINIAHQYEASIRDITTRLQYEVSVRGIIIRVFNRIKILIGSLAKPSLARSSLMRGRSNSTEVADLLNNL